jgi:CubicO group peptidase (beta-lactamase class C family)
MSQGHEMTDGKVAVMRPAADNAANWPAGSVFTNLADFSHFVAAMMNGGKIDGKQALPAKAVVALTTPHADMPGSHTKYGYGLDLEERGALRMWSHAGSRAGYGSFVAMLPDQHAAVIVLCNQTGQSLPRTSEKIVEMLGAPPRDRPVMAESEIPASEFANYAGTYRNGSSSMQIEERDGKLLFRSMELRKGGDGWLIAKNADGRIAARIFTVAGPDGKIEYLHMSSRSLARVR